MLNHNQEDLFAQYLITAVNKRDNNSMISHNTYVHYMYHIIIQLKQQMWVKYNLAGWWRQQRQATGRGHHHHLFMADQTSPR